MVESVITAVSLAIQEAFDSLYPVYAMDVAQELNEPCFFLEMISLAKKPLIGSRQLLTAALDIHFFPEDPADNLSMWDVAETLTGALTFVSDTDGMMYHCAGVSSTIADGVLHTECSCSATFYVPKEGENMEELTGAVNLSESLAADEDTENYMGAL